MDEAWERAVEAALEGQADESSSSPSPSPRTLTLDGAVKCLHGRLPPPSLLEKYQNLEHLSIANIGVSSLEKFPRLRNLQRLSLSDNRIAGGLEFLVEAGLDSLRDLDLSNNRIQFVEDLGPLAQLRLVSLDLYECPVTRVKDYRSRVFGMIRSLKYLDKMDADENERPESDEEEDDEEDEEEEEIDGDDPGSGEIDGEERGRKVANGVGGSEVGVVDVDEEESDADEEETETGGARREVPNGSSHHSSGFHVAAAREEVEDDGGEEEEDVEDDEEDDEEDGDDGEDEDVVEVHEVGNSDDEEDGGVQEEEDEEEDDEVEDDAYSDDDEVEDEEEEVEIGSAPRVAIAEGEIDGHEQGEYDESENGEIGEADEEGVEEDRDFEEDDEVNSHYKFYLIYAVCFSLISEVGVVPLTHIVVLFGKSRWVFKILHIEVTVLYCLMFLYEACYNMSFLAEVLNIPLYILIVSGPILLCTGC